MKEQNSPIPSDTLEAESATDVKTILLNFYYFCIRKTSAVLIRTRESRAYNWYAVVWEV